MRSWEEKYNIPDEDRTCINCKNFCRPEIGENRSEPCNECCNGWDGEKFEENHFEPDIDYIEFELADCGNCKHQGNSERCDGCSRRSLEDLWEEAD